MIEEGPPPRQDWQIWGYQVGVPAMEAEATRCHVL